MKELRVVLPASAIEAMSGDYEKGERGVHVSPPILHGLRLANFVSRYFYNNYERSSYSSDGYFLLGDSLEDLEAYELLTRGGFQAFDDDLDKQVTEIVSRVRSDEKKLQLKTSAQERAAFDGILEKLMNEYRKSRKAVNPLSLKLQRHFMAAVGGIYKKPEFYFRSTQEQEFPHEDFHRLAGIRDELFEDWDHKKFLLYLKLLDELRATELYDELMEGMSHYVAYFLPAAEIQALQEELEVEGLWLDLTKREAKR